MTMGHLGGQRRGIRQALEIMDSILFLQFSQTNIHSMNDNQGSGL